MTVRIYEQEHSISKLLAIIIICLTIHVHSLISLLLPIERIKVSFSLIAGGGCPSLLSRMQLCNQTFYFASYTSILLCFTSHLYHILHSTVKQTTIYSHVIGTSSTFDASTSNFFITSLSVRCPNGLITATMRPKIVFIGPIE